MPTEGDILNQRYQILRMLSNKGGMGVIYQAHDLNLNGTVVIKQSRFTEQELRRQFPGWSTQQVLGQVEYLRKAFEREAKLLFGLRHSALPRVLDYFASSDGNQFFVMEFIPGKDFAELLDDRLRQKQGPFPLDQVLGWAEQMIDALHYLHTEFDPPIIHRDIKPQNLKLMPKGQVILLDFGLAKGARPGMSVADSIFGGTPHYAPLEQINRKTNQQQPTDPRSNIYSLAVTLHHLLTGELPPDAVERVQAVAQGEPDPLRPTHELVPAIPVTVSTALQRAAAVFAKERPASVAELRQLLRQPVAPAPPTIIIPQPQPEPPTITDQENNSAEPNGEDEDEDFAAILAAHEKAHHAEISENEVVKGRVIKITDQVVIIDVGFKAEGIVPLAEFKDGDNIAVTLGDEVDVFVKQIENAEGYVELTRADAVRMQTWDNIEHAYKADIKARVVVPLDSGSQASKPVGEARPAQPQSFSEDLGDGVKLEMIYLPGGAFQMGSNDYESEKPIHRVVLSPFFIGKYPVTQAQWHAVMNTEPSHFKGAELPVESVSWEDAVKLCQRLMQRTSHQYRLPTEAEWEYACRAGSTGKWSFGNDESLLEQYAWYEKNSGNKTHPVGQKHPNKFGLYDMYGNLWEWCQDWYNAEYYGKSPERDPQGPTEGKYRVLRGGSWGGNGDFHCRSAYRSYDVPGVATIYYGFRVVCVARAS